MYTAIQKTWLWQCFNFPAFPLNRISNILSFFFCFSCPHTDTANYDLLHTVPLPGQRQKLFDSSTSRAHKNENEQRCVASLCHSMETPAGRQQLLLLECRALGLHSILTSSTLGSSATSMQAKLHILYPKGSISPQAHPTPSSSTDGNPEPPHSDNGLVPLWALSERTPSLQLSLDKPAVHPSPAGTQLHSVLRGGCKQNTKQNSTARAPTVKGGA